MSDAELLQTRWRLAADVIEEHQGIPGIRRPATAGPSPAGRLAAGVRVGTRPRPASSGARPDGELTLAEIIAAVSDLIGADPAALAQDTLERVRGFVLDGLLHPGSGEFID